MFKIYSHELRRVALKKTDTQSLPRKMYVSTLSCMLLLSAGKGGQGCRAAVHAVSCLAAAMCGLDRAHAGSLFPLVTREGCTSFWLQKTCGLPDSQAPREHQEARAARPQEPGRLWAS